MKIENIKSKLKSYFEKKIYENSSRCFGTDEELSEEEVKKLLYIIDFSEEIIKEYGSIEKWEKVMKKSNMKPYLYCYNKEKK